MSALGSEKVVRHRGGGDDLMGNPIADGAPVTYEGCAVYPRGAGGEETGRSHTVLDGYTVLIPPDQPDGVVVDIVPTDRIEWSRRPGAKAEVVGDVGQWPFLDGDLAGFQVNIRYEEG